MKSILVTGAAGFIGSNVAMKLLAEGYHVIGLDNLNDYYSVDLKKDRLSELETYELFDFKYLDICNKEELEKLFNNNNISYVVHLAAQAGVRYSIENPDSYIQSNIIGFYNILELCRFYPVDHLLYASSSSVYGANTKVPFSESDNVDHPVSLYAATKKSNELFASTYSHLYKIPATGLRFFTVYGPKGRPDMAYFGFVDKFFSDETISIYNDGDFDNDMYRDFTYIDDIVEGILSLLRIKPSDEKLHNVFNIGNNKPIKLMEFIQTLENCLSNSLNRQITFNKKFEPIKPGDVHATYADTSQLFDATGFVPTTEIKHGLQNFTDWYVEYYDKKGSSNNDE